MLEIDTAIGFVERHHAADTTTDDTGGSHRQRHVEAQARVRDRFARRDHRDLRDAIESRQLTLLEMLERIVVFNFGDDFLRQLFRRRRQCNGTETRYSALQSVPIGCDRVTQRGNSAQASNNDTAHADHDFFLATSFSMALTTSPTVSNSVRGLLVLALKGISISNFSSRSKIISTASSDSRPRASSRSDSSTVGLSTLFFFITIAITSLAISLIAFVPRHFLFVCSKASRRSIKASTFSCVRFSRPTYRNCS